MGSRGIPQLWKERPGRSPLSSGLLKDDSLQLLEVTLLTRVLQK